MKLRGVYYVNICDMVKVGGLYPVRKHEQGFIIEAKTVITNENFIFFSILSHTFSGHIMAPHNRPDASRAIGHRGHQQVR